MRDKPKSIGTGTTIGVAAVVVAAICCAGPVLIAAGALGVLGGAIQSPVIIAAGGLLLLGALAVVARRRGRAHGSADACCANPQGANHEHQLDSRAASRQPHAGQPGDAQ